MAYDKEQCKLLGRKIVDLGVAVSDGIDVSDVGEGMELLQAFMAAADEFGVDLDASLFYVASGLSEAIGDKRLDLPA